MGKKYRSYSTEFKRELIARIDSGELSLLEASREHDLAHSLVEKWRKRIHEGTLGERSTSREKQLERELDQYKKKVGELTLQVDLLKKLQQEIAEKRRQDGYIVTTNKGEKSGKDVKS